MLVRFAYLAVSHVFSALWLLRMTEREKAVEILALRHQLAVLRRQLGGQRPRLRPEDRALLAALLVSLARARLRRIRLLVSPDTVLRWHRDLMKRRQDERFRLAPAPAGDLGARRLLRTPVLGGLINEYRYAA